MLLLRVKKNKTLLSRFGIKVSEIIFPMTKFMKLVYRTKQWER